VRGEESPPAPAESPPAAGSPLPEIGRTRARPLCSVMHDVVGPAILAAQSADAHFTGARSALFDYVMETSPGARNLKHTRLDRVAIAMAEDVRKLKEAIEDKRFAAAAAPPASGEPAALFDTRAALRTLYDDELAQLNALSGFVETERFAQLRTELEGADFIRSVAGLPDRVPPKFGPGADRVTPNKNKPNQLANAHELDRWTGQIAEITTKNEDAASRVIVRVAALCH
jgi:hypothetical protein